MELALTLDISPRLEAALQALVAAVRGLEGVLGLRGLGSHEPVHRQEAPAPWEVVTVQSPPPTGRPPPTADPPRHGATGAEAELQRRKAQTAARVARHRAKKKREQGGRPAPSEQNSPETSNSGSKDYSTGGGASTNHVSQQTCNATDGTSASATCSASKGGLGGSFKDSSSSTEKNTPPKPPPAQPGSPVALPAAPPVALPAASRVAPRAEAAHRAERPRGSARGRAAAESQLELTPAAQVGATGPRHANPVHERVDAIWQAAGLGAYDWDHLQEVAWRGLLAKAGGSEEVAYQRLGYAADYAYPLCSGLPGLLKHWNRYGAPPEPGNSISARKRAAEPAPSPEARVGRAPAPEAVSALPDTEASRLWAAMVARFREVGAETAAQTLAEVRSVGLEDGALVSRWADGHRASFMSEFYGKAVRQRLQELLGPRAPEVRFEVAGATP